jgi:hypothetical protein
MNAIIKRLRTYLNANGYAWKYVGNSLNILIAKDDGTHHGLVLQLFALDLSKYSHFTFKVVTITSYEQAIRTIKSYCKPN